MFWKSKSNGKKKKGFLKKHSETTDSRGDLGALTARSKVQIVCIITPKMQKQMMFDSKRL